MDDLNRIKLLLTIIFGSILVICTLGLYYSLTDNLIADSFCAENGMTKDMIKDTWYCIEDNGFVTKHEFYIMDGTAKFVKEAK